jgi:hypothetical protein
MSKKLMTSRLQLAGLDPIAPRDLPHIVPPVPRGFTVWTDHEGKVYTFAPEDKRKSRGRVPETPKRWTLMKNELAGTVHWVPDDAYPTLPIREGMIHRSLKSEILFNIRATAKAPKCSTILRQEYGMTGTPVSLYMQFCKFRKLVPDPRIAERALAEGIR